MYALNRFGFAVASMIWLGLVIGVWAEDATQLRFSHYTLDDGLGGSRVFDIFCDRRGFVWIATDDGLHRFDGQEFIVFRAAVGDPDAIGASHVRKLGEEPSGDLWIATRGAGLNRMDHRTGKCRTYRHDPDLANSISHDDLYDLHVSPSGSVWVGSVNGGLDRFDPHTETFEHIDLAGLRGDRSDPVSVLSVHEDRAGILWIGTQNDGLWRWHPETDELHVFPTDPGEVGSIGDRDIVSLHEDRSGSIWVGTYKAGLHRIDPDSLQVTRFEAVKPAFGMITGMVDGPKGCLWIATYKAGLVRLDPKTGAIRSFSYEPGNPTSIIANELMAIGLDHSGAVWVGTEGYGASRVDLNQKPFENYIHLEASPKLDELTITDVIRDRDNRIWFGYRKNGIGIFDPERTRFEHLSTESKGPLALAHNDVRALAIDAKGLVYIGYENHGIERLNPENGARNRYTHDPKVADSLSYDRVTALLPDEPGAMWVGTYGGGLNHMDTETGSFTRFRSDKNDPTAFPGGVVMTLYRDRSGHLWIGTLGKGLIRFLPERTAFERFTKNPGTPGTISNNDILALHETADGALWIGTYGGGLNRRDPDDGRFRQWTSRNGLPSDMVFDMLEDPAGNLWFGSVGYLVKFDPVTEAIETYDKSDGILPVAFSQNVSITDAAGRLYFGGGNTFCRFRPDRIGLSDYQPPVTFTDISLAGKSITRAPNMPHAIALQAPLETLPSATEALTLSHEQRMVRFDFTALHFTQPEHLRYRYRMDGFDKQWIETDATQRNATYTNLDAGDYRFRVQATNEDGVWSERSAQMRLSVLPPIWLTWWAKLLYALTVATLVAIYLFQQRAKLEGQRHIANQEKEIARHARESAEKDRMLASEAQKVAARLGQLNKLKDEFLANTSHELRTPLQGIIGLTESLIDGAAGKLARGIADNLQLVVAEGHRLAHLVDDLLDFSQLRHRVLDLRIEPVDLRAAVDLVLTLTRPRIRDRPLMLVNEVPADFPMVAADENRLQQIVHNLVGNAVKFTDTGKVSIRAEQCDGSAHISVQDTGIGIPHDKWETIFNSFEQLDGSATRARGGTGLGLSISRALIEQQGGHIGVHSVPNQGSTFTFTLPLATDIQTGRSVVAPQLPVVITADGQEDGTVQPVAEPVGLHVLVVDDEPVNRRVLQNHLLTHGYRVTTVGDGHQALETLQSPDPDIDLILLDVMMPGVTGYEVCRTIRESHRLQEMPVIFLTAKTGLTDLVAAFRLGANDFLAKPVSKEELLARIRTQRDLLDLHRNLEDKVRTRTQQLAERTAEVETQHAELQNLYGIVRALNRLAHLEEIFEVLLHQGLKLFDSADRAALLVREEDRFRFTAMVGHSRQEVAMLSEVRIEWKALIDRYMHQSERIGANIFRIDNAGALAPIAALATLEPSLSLVALAITIEARVEGFLVFSNTRETFAFSDIEARRLDRFREHATAAVSRARLLRAIERQKEEIVHNQEIILRQEKLASLGTMTAGIAHEINNPNNFIAGGADSLAVDLTRFRDFLLALLGDEPDTELVEAFDERLGGMDEHIELIRMGSKRITKIVANLMRLTSLDRVGHAEARLVDSLAGAIDMLSAIHPSIQLQVEIDETIRVASRSEAMEHVFTNLLANACEAIQTAERETGRVTITADRTSGEVAVHIRDNGCGIAPERMGRLFDAFYTTREVGSGTGLGLFTSHQIVHDCGGRIEVDSTAGRGTTFTVWLPQAQEPAGETGALAPEPSLA
ncbi:Response regulator [Sulfidibacter corallicola]|uniref:histidine kinase n=1 Tax=Sulfidibacter corallicola TaxID=2818388 RepID=A0A8A4TLW8_SULCO|nr:ATP-binding protein [Sulfidibacter corallicola]QTD50979.1 response regulator [Sulfidibacter corallicola]